MVQRLHGYWITSCSWLRLAGVLLLLGSGLLAGGCGAPSEATDAYQRRTQEEARRYQIVLDVLGILEQHGMGEWASYGRSYLERGAIVPIDFSSPEANQFGATHLDAAANFADGSIYLDQTAWVTAPPRYLAVVLLDELAHFRYVTTEHVEYEKLMQQFTPEWERQQRQPWFSLGAHEAEYVEWARQYYPYWLTRPTWYDGTPAGDEWVFAIPGE